MQQASDGNGLPDEQVIDDWLQAALNAAGYAAERDVEISVRVVDEAEARELNSRYRDRDYATNVLSFPADAKIDFVGADESLPLGDLVICAPVVLREAGEQGKKPADHWAHLLVHGALHLLGYDHEADADAERMEALETSILTAKGLPDPYAGEATG